MSALDTLRRAAAEIGYFAPDDDEPGSRAGRWLAKVLNQPWLRGPSRTIWWCMCFASWMVYEGGGKLPGGPTFNTDTLLRAARREGWGIIPVHTARPGDLAIYDWNEDGATDHVGIIERTYSWGVQTIEGNTSPDNSGSQSAGNGVWRRTREWNDVDYVVRPRYSGHSVGGSAGAPGVIAVDGEIGRASIKLAQKLYHTPVDGEIWDQPAELREHLPALDFPGGGLVFGTGDHGSSLVRALQTTLNRGGFNVGRVDGVFGPGTVRGLQRALGVEADGYLGYNSAVAWQSWMNEEARKRGITSL